MVFFVAAIVLAALSVAAFPCWSHSRRWGYGPSAAAGALLILLAVMAIANKTTPKAVASTSGPIELAAR